MAVGPEHEPDLNALALAWTLAEQPAAVVSRSGNPEAQGIAISGALLVRSLHVAAPYGHATRPQKSEMGMSGLDESLQVLGRLPLMVVKMVMLPCPEDSSASRSGATSRIVQDARRISRG